MSAHNIEPENFRIANRLVLSVKSSQLNYGQAKEVQRKKEDLA